VKQADLLAVRPRIPHLRRDVHETIVVVESGPAQTAVRQGAIMTRLAGKRSASFLAVVATCACLGCNNSRLPFTRKWRLNRTCAAAGREFWNRSPQDGLDYRTRPARLKAFYSSKIDTCVQVEVNELWFFYDIRDITHGFLKDEQLLFHCDRDGTDNVVLARARQAGGYSGKGKHYMEWLDNEAGGPPRSIKAPPHPYAREDCERALSRKLAELR
jgi:hypothetical protein